MNITKRDVLIWAMGFIVGSVFISLIALPAFANLVGKLDVCQIVDSKIDYYLDNYPEDIISDKNNFCYPEPRANSLNFCTKDLINIFGYKNEYVCSFQKIRNPDYP